MMVRAAPERVPLVAREDPKSPEPETERLPVAWRTPFTVREAPEIVPMTSSLVLGAFVPMPILPVAILVKRRGAVEVAFVPVPVIMMD